MTTRRAIEKQLSEMTTECQYMGVQVEIPKVVADHMAQLIEERHRLREELRALRQERA